MSGKPCRPFPWNSSAIVACPNLDRVSTKSSFYAGTWMPQSKTRWGWTERRFILQNNRHKNAKKISIWFMPKLGKLWMSCLFLVLPGFQIDLKSDQSLKFELSFWMKFSFWQCLQLLLWNRMKQPCLRILAWIVFGVRARQVVDGLPAKDDFYGNEIDQ